MIGIEFGLDYLNVLAIMNKRDKNGGSPIGFAIARMFLVDWELSPQEVDIVNKMFWEKVDNDSLDTMDKVQSRILRQIGNNEAEKKRMLRQLAALACLDNELSDEEIAFFRHWAEVFDMKPSEASEIVKKGNELAMALNFVGSFYIDSSQKK